MKKSKLIKFLLPLFLVILVSLFSFSCFADAYEVVPFANIAEYRPGVVQGDIYYTTNYNNTTWSAQMVDQKLTGVIGVHVDYDDNRLVNSYEIIRSEFDLTIFSDNQRQCLSFARGQFYSSYGELPVYGYIGWTLRCNPWLPGGDVEEQGIVLDVYRTHSYTLDYPSQERYYLPFSDIDATLAYGLVYECNFNMYCDVNQDLHIMNLYLSTSSGSLLLDTLYYEPYSNFNPWVAQWGMFDSFNHDDPYLVPAIRNYTRYIVDNGFTEGYQLGYENGLDAGYDDGYDDGYDKGKRDWYRVGIDEGYDDGYGEGYIAGAKAEGGVLEVPEVVDSVFVGVGSIFDSFDLSIFGISIAGLLVSLIVAVIVIWIIKKVK